jgi:hypothetical protein
MQGYCSDDVVRHALQGAVDQVLAAHPIRIAVQTEPLEAPDSENNNAAVVPKVDSP